MLCTVWVPYIDNVLQFTYSFDKERKIVYGDDKSHDLDALALPVRGDKPQSLSPRHRRKHKSKSKSTKKADKQQDPGHLQ